jgi:hypothetical protein
MRKDFRQAALDAIQAQNDLLAAWQGFRENVNMLSLEDVPILRELIERRIFVINAFEFLLSIDHSSAVNILLEVYLGKGVSPDFGYGGFAFEMSSMLSDLVRQGGEESLHRLVNQPAFNADHLRDKRFRAACADALGLTFSTLPPWLNP